MSLAGMLSPPAVVDPPLPTPAPHSLLATALDVTEPPVSRPGPNGTVEVEEWAGGLTFRPDPCDQGGVWVPCVTSKSDDLNPNGSGSGSGEQLKSRFDSVAAPLFVPFMVEGTFTCGTTGFEEAGYVKTARRHLEAIQTKQVELEFWSGQQMEQHPVGIGNMSLQVSTPDDGVLNPGGAAAPVAVSPRAALALLQQGLANCSTGSRGMIHVTPYLAELWAGADMTKDDGQRLSAKTRGTWIVSGAGYPGTGPIIAGEEGEAPVLADNHVWAYGTGIVNYRLGKVRLVPGESEMATILAQAMRRNENEVSYTAERFAAAVWDPCCTVAVLVDLAEGVC